MKSVIFHATIVVVLSVGFVFKDDVVDFKETPIEVAFMSEADLPPQPKKPEPTKELPPPIEDKPQPAPKALEQPKPKPKAEKAEKTEEKMAQPKVEDKPKEEPKPKAEPKEKPKKPEQKPKPEPKADDKPKEKEPEKPAEKDTESEFMSVLKNLQDSTPTDTQRRGPTLTQSPTIDRMTTGELDAFRQQLSRCWSILPGAVQAEALAVNLTITVNRDRTVKDVQITDRNRYASDPYFRAAADNAIRAIKHPDCTPLDLPPEKYDTWNTITLNFDPRTMF